MTDKRYGPICRQWVRCVRIATRTYVVIWLLYRELVYARRIQAVTSNREPVSSPPLTAHAASVVWSNLSGHVATPALHANVTTLSFVPALRV